MATTRPATLRAAVAACCACGALGGIAASATAQASAASSANQLLSAAMNDAGAKSSVHENELVRSKSFDLIYRDDVGRDSGNQEVVSTNGLMTRVLIVNGAAYIIGNQAALRFMYGLSAKAAKEIGTKWVSVPASDSVYASTVGNVTLASALGAVRPGGRLTETGPTKVDGTPAIGIHGTAPAQSGGGEITLYVSRSGTPLPLSATVHSRGSTLTATFTAWDEQLALKSPTVAVPITRFQK